MEFSRRTAVFGLLGLYVALSCSSSEAPCPNRGASGCPGSPGTEIRFPLTRGNVWIYSVTSGQQTYERTDSITGYARFNGEQYAILERRSPREHEIRLVRQEGSMLFMFGAEDTLGLRGDSLRATLPWAIVDFDEPQGKRDLYDIHYIEDDCPVPAHEWEATENLGRQEYVLDCCLLSKVQKVHTTRTRGGPCPAYELTEDTVYHIADRVGIVSEQYRWELYAPPLPNSSGAVGARLVSWKVQTDSTEGVLLSQPGFRLRPSSSQVAR